MRIGLVTGEYPPMHGGVGAYSHLLAVELARQGRAVFVLSSSATREDHPAINLSNNIRRWNLGSLRAIGNWAHNNRLDVVNLQFQTAAFALSPWIHFLPDALRTIPVVTTFHDLRYPYLFPKAGPLRPWIVHHLARASAGIIVTNHEDAQQVQMLSKVALIPIGSNILEPLPPDFDPRKWRAKAGAQPGDFLLAYFGLFNRSKGIDTLLAGLAQLHAAGLPARLVLIGGGAGSSDPTNAAFMAQMNSMIERHHLAPFIHQTGYLDESAVGAYLTASDAVVLPFADGASYRRGSLMAALHYGCAIITTTPQVAVPTFKDGDNMLLVPPGDSAALVQAINRLRAAPDLRDHLRRGAARLANAFRWDTIARDTITFFRRITEGS
ncbi:MAG: glycosyltransferase [Chloroflexi bacterium]|nr:glycosyltransferase [Chloroflexota bacterium]